MLNRFSNHSISSARQASVEVLEDRRLMTASFDIGINLNDGASATVGKVVPVLKHLGVKSIRLWESTNFSSYRISGVMQRAIDYSNAGFNVTLEVCNSGGKVYSASAVKNWFEWAVSNPALKNAVDQWEIGNEPDHYSYWQGSLSSYVNNFLKPAYEALHPAGEDVISAGPSWNPQDVQSMIDDGLLNYTDYVGYHPYANGAAAVAKSVAAINGVVAGRKPIAATEWNVRGYEGGDKSAWARAVADVYPTIKAGFDLNYYFALKVQNSMAGPAGILTTGLNPNQPFYNAFATFNGVTGTPPPVPTVPATPTTPAEPGNTPSGNTGSIVGTLFNDSDEDGVFDGSESVTGSRTVYLDANANGAFDAGEQSTQATAAGTYAFTGLARGTYNVSRVFPSGYKLSNSSTGYISAKLAVSQKLTVNLGTTYDRPATPPPDEETPTVPPAVSTPTVTSVRVIDAKTNLPIGGVPTVAGVVTIPLSLLPSTGINFQVIAEGDVESVKTTAAGQTRVENNAPFAVFGDNNGDFLAYAPTKGGMTISATAYSGNSASGVQGATLTTTFMFT